MEKQKERQKERSTIVEWQISTTIDDQITGGGTAKL